MSANEYIVINGVRYAAIVPVSYKADNTPNLDSAGNPAVNTTLFSMGASSQSRNRLLTAIAETTYAAATNSMTWSAADNIREVTVLITATNSEASPAINPENYCNVCFNAGNDAIATAWLAEVNSAVDDCQHEKITIGERVTFRFTSPITRLDFLPVDISATLSVIKAFVGAH